MCPVKKCMFMLQKRGQEERLGQKQQDTLIEADVSLNNQELPDIMGRVVLLSLCAVNITSTSCAPPIPKIPPDFPHDLIMTPASIQQVCIRLLIACLLVT